MQLEFLLSFLPRKLLRMPLTWLSKCSGMQCDVTNPREKPEDKSQPNPCHYPTEEPAEACLCCKEGHPVASQHLAFSINFGLNYSCDIAVTGPPWAS